MYPFMKEAHNDDVSLSPLWQANTLLATGSYPLSYTPTATYLGEHIRSSANRDAGFGHMDEDSLRGWQRILPYHLGYAGRHCFINKHYNS
jgi:hypothetical protein